MGRNSRRRKFNRNAPKAPYDQSRVSPMGREIGAVLAHLAEDGIAALAMEGAPDSRCATCAFRKGTVPNACYSLDLIFIDYTRHTYTECLQNATS
jgi:hypothetical protein